MTGAEGIAGVTSIFNSYYSVNWSQVLIPGRALRINARLFKQILDNCQVFQKLLFEFINCYISQISQRAICNNHHTVEERLCVWLLMVSKRSRNNQLPLTQEQIARFLGVHRPSITLVTQSLRKEGAIDYVRGKVSILDKEKLRELACSCYLSQKNSRNDFKFD